MQSHFKDLYLVDIFFFILSYKLDVLAFYYTSIVLFITKLLHIDSKLSILLSLLLIKKIFKFSFV